MAREKAFRREVAEHGIRWTNNILVEIISNHGEVVGEEARLSLRQAIQALENASRALRSYKKETK